MHFFVKWRSDSYKRACSVVDVYSGNTENAILVSFIYFLTISRGIIKWRCAIHNSNIKCNAKVNQDGNKFIRCSNPHLCTPKPGVSTTLQIHKEINKEACQDVHASAAEITERLLAERVTNEPTTSLPAPVQFAQNAN